jgi:5S rRNA maturation endonuclease (ribonuclease M5)
VRRTPDKSFPQSGDKADRSLYGSDRIGDAEHVLVVEGEKDVDAARAIGVAAVCSAMGAGKAHLADWDALRGKHVTVVPDDDEAGRRHAAQVVDKVRVAGAASVRVARTAVGKDLADHVAAGKGIEDLVAVDTDPTGEPTTWEAFDLGPWLTGDVKSPQPTVGISRTDGQKLIYAGREHTVFGETEAGKSWFALECCAVEIRMGRDVVYVHYEEGDPASTIERLRLLSVTPTQIVKHLRFVAPGKPARGDWLAALLDPPPALVVHDGVNEAMSLHGDDSNHTDGAATFRRNIIKPCLAVGAATLSCDHVTKSSGDGRGRYAIGAGHKIAAVDGAAFLMENIEPFGRGLRGASSVYVTKDRPGQLRAHGTATGLPGKTLIGVLAVDATGNSPDFLALFPPKHDEPQDEAGRDPDAELVETVYRTIAAQPEHAVPSRRRLLRLLRAEGASVVRDERLRDALEDLVIAGRVIEVPGRAGSKGYLIVSSASQPVNDEVRPASASASASPIEGDAGTQYAPDCVGRGGTRWDAVGESDGAGQRDAAITEVKCLSCGAAIPDTAPAKQARRDCGRAACRAAAKAESGAR